MAAPRRDRQTPRWVLLSRSSAARELLLGAGWKIERAAALLPTDETLKHELRVLLGRLRGMAERLELEP